MMNYGIHGNLLEVTVVSCNKLKDREWISRQDPYVCVEYGSNKNRTRVCTDGGTNPTFHEKFVYSLIEGLRELNIIVWDINAVSHDDFISCGKVQLAMVLSYGYDDSSWPLQTKSGRHAGEVRLIMHYSNANKPTNSYGTSSAPQVSMDSAPPLGSSMFYPPSPYPPQARPYPPQPYPPNSAYPPQPYRSHCFHYFNVPFSYVCGWLPCLGKTEMQQSLEIDHGSLNNYYSAPAYSFDKICRATGNFDAGRKLGRGVFTAVYGADFPNGVKAAVKRFLKTSQYDFKVYQEEVCMVNSLSHPNVVDVNGWCYKMDVEFLVVYELVENGSLDNHLFDSEKPPLSWESRKKIAYDMAVALDYLHHRCSRCVLHRDIKPTNILLDRDFNAKLGDFGIAKLLDSTRTSGFRYTPGYVAPECGRSGEFTKKSDVYGYGVVLLQITTGRKVFNNQLTEAEKELVKWARDVYNAYQSGTYQDVDVLNMLADPRLDGQYIGQQMMSLLTLGLLCVSENPEDRLSMEKVVSYLALHRG